MAAEREFDIVLFGATGYTGRWGLEHLLKNYTNGADCKFAIAGRNQGKMNKVLEDMEVLGLTSDVPTIVADSFDRESLMALCKRTKVVCSTVGPFEQYGNLLVECCVECYTSYCDITGEVHWVRTLIDKYHEVCEERKIAIIPCCGFDCLPADIGSFLAASALKEKFDEKPTTIDGFIWSSNGGVSGGTLATVMGTFEKSFAEKKVMGKIMSNNLSLTNKTEVVNGSMWPKWSKKFKIYGCFFPLSPGNIRIAQRSEYLLDYGEGLFLYNEYTRIGKNNFINLLAGICIPLFLSFFFLICMIPPVRWYIVPLFLPKPGQGPTREACEKGFVNMKFHAQSANNNEVVVTWSSNADPGYKGTGLQLVESGLALALGGIKRGGILTPASGMGNEIVARLENIGFLKIKTE